MFVKTKPKRKFLVGWTLIRNIVVVATKPKDVTTMIEVRKINQRGCDWWYSYKRSLVFSLQDCIHLGSRSESRAYWTGRMSENPVSDANCTGPQKVWSHSAVKSSCFFVYSFFKPKNTGFYRWWGVFLELNQWEFMSDYYHSESSGAINENQSAIEFKICTHGSDVCNCCNQRVFFLLATPQFRHRQ